MPDTFSIYQLRRGEETRDFRFEPLDRLTANGLAVERGNYELIYSAPLAEQVTLDSIYEKFNINHPPDYKGHSLSVSDVIVLYKDGKEKAFYVDSFGFSEIPSFTDSAKINEKQFSTFKVRHVPGALKNSLGFITAPENCGVLFVDAHNCNVLSVHEEMLALSNRFNKLPGIIHVRYSFSPNDALQEQAHKFALHLASAISDYGHQAVIATHNTHSHIIMNSTDPNGKRCFAMDIYGKVAKQAQHICEAHGLPPPMDRDNRIKVREKDSREREK